MAAGIVRQLKDGDATTLRAVWLEALKAEPEFYGAQLGSAQKKPLTYYKKRINRGAAFGGFVKGKMVGFGAIRPMRLPGMHHKADMWGLYLREPLRGTGLAEDIIEAIEEYARQRFDVINVRVVDQNLRMRRFLDRTGYKLFGIERRALKSEGRYFDEEMRAKRLL
jgi:RimJ/RimL family protein N-acetyltransferase